MLQKFYRRYIWNLRQFTFRHGGARRKPCMNKAINNITIAKAVDEGYLDEDFFEDTDDPDALVKKSDHLPQSKH